jgi:hypothetical protein
VADTTWNFEVKGSDQSIGFHVRLSFWEDGSDPNTGTLWTYVKTSGWRKELSGRNLYSFRQTRRP